MKLMLTVIQVLLFGYGDLENKIKTAHFLEVGFQNFYMF